MVIAHDYQHLKIEYPDDGVLLVTINRPEVGNRANARLHWELGQIWLDVSSDPDTRVAVITGAGDAFCGGGELQKFLDQINDFPKIAQLIKEAKDIVQNMANCEKPIISAINGMANGVGAAVGLSADISIAGENALISDGHVRMGIANHLKTVDTGFSMIAAVPEQMGDANDAPALQFAQTGAHVRSCDG